MGLGMDPRGWKKPHTSIIRPISPAGRQVPRSRCPAAVTSGSRCPAAVKRSMCPGAGAGSSDREQVVWRGMPPPPLNQRQQRGVARRRLPPGLTCAGGDAHEVVWHQWSDGHHLPWVARWGWVGGRQEAGGWACKRSRQAEALPNTGRPRPPRHSPEHPTALATPQHWPTPQHCPAVAAAAAAAAGAHHGLHGD